MGARKIAFAGILAALAPLSARAGTLCHLTQDQINFIAAAFLQTNSSSQSAPSSAQLSALGQQFQQNTQGGKCKRPSGEAAGVERPYVVNYSFNDPKTGALKKGSMDIGLPTATFADWTPGVNLFPIVNPNNDTGDPREVNWQTSGLGLDQGIKASKVITAYRCYPDGTIDLFVNNHGTAQLYCVTEAPSSQSATTTPQAAGASTSSVSQEAGCTGTTVAVALCNNSSSSSPGAASAPAVGGAWQPPSVGTPPSGSQPAGDANSAAGGPAQSSSGD